MTIIEKTVTITRDAATTGVTDFGALLVTGFRSGHIRRLTVREDATGDKGDAATVYVVKAASGVAPTVSAVAPDVVHSVAGVTLAGSATVASSDEKIVDQKASFPHGFDLHVYADITSVGVGAATQTILHVTALIALEG